MLLGSGGDDASCDSADVTSAASPDVLSYGSLSSRELYVTFAFTSATSDSGDYRSLKVVHKSNFMTHHDGRFSQVTPIIRRGAIFHIPSPSRVVTTQLTLESPLSA